jgi:HAD superfamily hydrolase (TIGR01509 family)
MIKAFLFGSVGVLAETSELQRRAYNAAFELNNIEWRWNIGTYCSLLADPGGKNRLYRFSGGDLTAAEITKIHSDKQDFFDDFVRAGIKPRPGCVEIIRKCKANNIKVGLVTTTTPETLASLKIGLAGLIDFDDFDVVTTKESVEKEKPDREVYQYALRALEVTAGEAVAVEDTKANQASALGCDIKCYLFPGEYAEVDAGSSAKRDYLASSLCNFPLID